MKMISTFLMAAAFYQSAAVRPERAGAGSAALGKVGDLLEPARVLASSMNTLETAQAIKAASGIVDKILLQQGNATKHMEANDKQLLQQVVDLLTTTVYGSMDSSHTADEKSLSTAIADIEKCNTDIANRQSATGDLGKMHQGVKNKQEELNSLQAVVDEKTAANNTAWEALALHMSLMSDPPEVPAFPARTMGALDVYFERSHYCLWFGAEQAAFIEKRDIWAAANKALEDAIAAYNIMKAKRDVQFCDWKSELEESCSAFKECYAAKSQFYTQELKPRVTTDMSSRLENFKAGETLIQQIKFLLAESGTRETPTVKTSRYEIDFPSVPAQGTCDLSPLTSSEWVPTVSGCKDTQASSVSVNLVQNGGFEQGWKQPWKMVSAGSDGLPGWDVTVGNIDFGNYKTGGHCAGKPCAHEGESFIDICGSHRGAIAQSIPTRPGGRYRLKVAYDAHATCTGRGTVMRMDVAIGGKVVATLEHTNERTWNLDWAEYSHQFEAKGKSTRLELKSQNSGCGCMLVDAVQVNELGR